MIHPDDADELQEIARELGGESLSGPLRYPSRTGSWQLGETDLGEWFEPFRDQEIVLVAVAVGQAAPSPITCGICGCRYDVLGPCPQCGRVNREEAKRIEEELRRRREEIEGLLRGIEEFLASEE